MSSSQSINSGGTHNNPNNNSHPEGGSMSSLGSRGAGSVSSHSSRQQQHRRNVAASRSSANRPSSSQPAPAGSMVDPPPQQQQQQQQQQHPTNYPALNSVGSRDSLTASSSIPGNAPQQQQQQQQQAVSISVESPLPPVVQRCLGDRSYEKRKNAALEIEILTKRILQEESNSHHHNNNTSPMVRSVVSVLTKDFCTSMNSNYRKGGLIGIAATAIGLMHHTRHYLEFLLPPVLHCFDDPESRVRYYACESLYNIAKVARTSILRYFNQMFDGLTKLFADVDVDVKNGANLLDRLLKDIVTESDTFHVEQFLPLLQNYIRRTNPYIRQLLVGWITVLDSVPDVNMIDYLPDFLDGLFNMLSDSNREIRQAADSALSDFLREVRLSKVLEFGPMVSILVSQCNSKERLNRLTAISWLAELIYHPYNGGDALLPYHAEVLGAIMRCLSDAEAEIRQVADRTNGDLLTLVQETRGVFELSPLLDTLTAELLGKDDVPTKMAALRWINMLLEKRKGDMNQFIPELLPLLLRTLSDSSDAVVLLNVQVLSRISLSHTTEPQDASSTVTNSNGAGGGVEENQFQMVLNAILGLFAADRKLLEIRGSLVIRKLCVLLNAQSVYIRMADTLSSYDSCVSTSNVNNNNMEPSLKEGGFTLEFVATMVQTLNLILLTAPELHALRTILAKSFEEKESTKVTVNRTKKIIAMHRKLSSPVEPPAFATLEEEGANVFASLFPCWCHNPVATFSLCLLARAYDVAFCLVKRFSELEVTVGFLMQIDKLVQLLESPIFVHLRLQLLDIEAPYHAPLLKSCYGLLMLLPQSDAFRSLNDRLTTVCNLRDNLGVSPIIASHVTADQEDGVTIIGVGHLFITKRAGLDSQQLLASFDEVMELHRQARVSRQQQPSPMKTPVGAPSSASTTTVGAGTTSVITSTLDGASNNGIMSGVMNNATVPAVAAPHSTTARHVYGGLGPSSTTHHSTGPSHNMVSHQPPQQGRTNIGPGGPTTPSRSTGNTAPGTLVESIDHRGTR